MIFYMSHKQERFKGRWMQSALGGFAGTSEMGWGFSSQGYYGNGQPPLCQSVYNPIDPDSPVIVRAVPYSANAADAASAAQLRADPVFNHEPPEILSGNLQTGDIDILLARGVPALSNPMGGGSAQEISGVNAQDLDEYSSDQNWPHVLEPKWKGWRHSDIKDVALPFVRGVFETMKGAVPQ